MKGRETRNVKCLLYWTPNVMRRRELRWGLGNDFALMSGLDLLVPLFFILSQFFSCFSFQQMSYTSIQFIREIIERGYYYSANLCEMYRLER